MDISEDQECQCSNTLLHHLGQDLISNILRKLGGDFYRFAAPGFAASCKDLLYLMLGSGGASLQLDTSKADLAW